MLGYKSALLYLKMRSSELDLTRRDCLENYENAKLCAACFFIFAAAVFRLL
jgi:hypothetical protein